MQCRDPTLPSDGVKSVRSLFLLCTGNCRVSDEIVSTRNVPGACSELMLLLVQEPIGSSGFWVLSAGLGVLRSGF